MKEKERLDEVAAAVAAAGASQADLSPPDKTGHYTKLVLAGLLQSYSLV